MIQQLGLWLLKRTPRYNETLFRVCRRYTDRYLGINQNEESGESLVIRNLVRSAKVVFDIGANVGDWTAEVTSINLGVRVHCFEPGRAAYQRLAMRHFPDTVHLNRAGVGAEEGTAVLNIGPTSDTSSLYPPPSHAGLYSASRTGTEKVRITTVDAYCMENAVEAIDFLKIDVEGHELAVISGASRMLGARAVACIQWEHTAWAIQSRTLLKDFFDVFSGLGYTVCKIYPEGIRVIEAYDHRIERYAYSNWLAVAEKGILAAFPEGGPRRYI